MPTKRKNSIGQEDFLKLKTTQLQNQDPFAPMENGEFIAQMAQFSTVTGITEMGQTLKGLSDKPLRVCPISVIPVTVENWAIWAINSPFSIGAKGS